MVDAWRALPDGRAAILQVLPTTFNWPLFWVALLLMTLPALHQVVLLALQEVRIEPALTAGLRESWPRFLLLGQSRNGGNRGKPGPRHQRDLHVRTVLLKPDTHLFAGPISVKAL